jgi:asparagine synthase (glutamine-hydrolysing)
MMEFRTRFNLEADMLVKVDRMSMAHSLEVRAPFLDPEVAQVAWSLPDDLLLRKGVGKWIVRRAVRALLPEVVFRHPKQGFAIPLHRYQNEEYERLTRQVLLETGSLQGLFSREALTSLLAHAGSQRQDTLEKSVYRASHQVWALVQFGGWMQRFKVRLP